MQRCLLLEDHPAARKWLSQTLERAFPGTKIKTADNLAEGREALAWKPDFALVDLSLPDGDGSNLIPELVELGCEVVVATMFGDEDHLLAALKAGAKGYLLKDQPQEELMQLLQGTLNGTPALSPLIARKILDYFSTVQESVLPHNEDTVLLTTRESEVLTLLAKGYTIKAAAEVLGITQNTTSGYTKALYRKLNVSSRAEVALEAKRRGYVG
ncbi:MAG: response regulator transcription factor [Pseudomonadales bacterium]|nr:response regulator transcription factor [Pseudomonadales bacterium]MBO6565471.1 response regulator transcription factor [Pseudomonadales bacterium]MBO6597265.1 response regulator transcription factor [Pseudomonadales bacterium]MBO6656892.1 response regulator transcription factor [Pseudomonadales bacterium]MBO6703894.1 response regulator transcription factor [Pseudomonadales bacterium]